MFGTWRSGESELAPSRGKSGAQPQPESRPSKQKQNHGRNSHAARNADSMLAARGALKKPLKKVNERDSFYTSRNTTKNFSVRPGIDAVRNRNNLLKASQSRRNIKYA